MDDWKSIMPRGEERAPGVNNKIIDLYKNQSVIGPRENKLYLSGSHIEIKLSPKIKYIYYWAEMMDDLSYMKPRDFVKRDLVERLDSYRPERKVLELLLYMDLKSLGQISDPTGKDRNLNEKVNILNSSSMLLYILFGMVFFINFPYSMYLTAQYFAGTIVVLMSIAFIGLIIFLVALYKIYFYYNEKKPQFYIMSDLFVGIVELILIYGTHLSSTSANISLLLFILLMFISVLSLKVDKWLKSGKEKLSQRLPIHFRIAGLIGNERVTLIPEMIFAKDRFLKILSTADTTIDGKCPRCNGSGKLINIVTCPSCGGSRLPTYSYNRDNQLVEKFCKTCSGSGTVNKEENCEFCVNGKVPVEKYEKELKEKITLLSNKISSFNDNFQKNIDEVNKEIGYINKKISIWNSKTV